MVNDNKIMKVVGRPKGTVKDPNRLKIINPNGRKIDVDGVQYKKYIRQGYDVSVDKTRIVLPENVTPKILKPGRPKGCKNKVTKVKIQNIHEKVENPDTKRMIRTDNVTFKNLVKKYHYNPETNELYKYVSHPKKPDVKLDVTGEDVKKFEKKGYIFDKEKNKIIVPGKMTTSAFKKTLFDYDFEVVNDKDPLGQMKLLGIREEVILKKALQQHKGITFNTVMEIKFVKNVGEVIYKIFPFAHKLMTITSKEEISNVRRVMNAHINGMIDQFTNQGSGWTINRVMRHYLHINKYLPLAARSYIKLPPKFKIEKQQ